MPLTLASFSLRSRSSSVIGLASPKGLLFAEEGAGPATASIGAVLQERDGGGGMWSNSTVMAVVSGGEMVLPGLQVQCRPLAGEGGAVTVRTIAVTASVFTAA